MKIIKRGEELVIRIPLKQPINNCYMPESKAMTDNLIGVVAGDEFTISQLCDLSYKGDQQEGMPIIYFNSREELEKACKIGGIEIWTIPVCADCGKPARGCSSWTKKGVQCKDCSEKYEDLNYP